VAAAAALAALATGVSVAQAGTVEGPLFRTCNGQIVTTAGTGAATVIHGTLGNDVIVGLGGDAADDGAAGKGTFNH
jgi:hypothetical protein